MQSVLVKSSGVQLHDLQQSVQWLDLVDCYQLHL